jgi:pSer/pThr/pTyr-binding forkhead associated (FHA) protein/anti-anti-sigma regulatory factor
MLRVVIEKGGQVLQDGVYRKELISLGRDARNDVVIDDPLVSAQHLVVREDQEHGQFRLFDQSQNGTYWEGERVASLRFDTPTIVRVAGMQVTLIPIQSSGTEEMPVDVYASTLVEPLPKSDEEAPMATAPHKAISPKALSVGDAELRSISPTGEMKTLVFQHDALLGRAPECDLQFTTREISRRHAHIVAGPGGYVLRRLSKKNPVTVNDREVDVGEAMALRDGDVIRLCDEEIIFLYPATQPRSETRQNVTLEAAPNLDLAVNRRGCADPAISAFDVVGFLGSKTWQKFEDRMRGELRFARAMLIDLGYLVGIDRDGLQSLSRVIKDAEQMNVRVQLIRVTPRIADLLSYSELKQMLSLYISKSEDTAIKRLHG